MAKEKDKLDVPTPAFSLPELKKYTKEDLLKIFDELIFQGEYTEEVTLKGRLKIRFRSRTADETMRISQELDGSEYKMITTMQERRAFLNLRASLITYQGKDLSSVSDEEKTKIIKKLPTSMVSALADSLSEFDRKVDLACREAEENF